MLSLHHTHLGLSASYARVARSHGVRHVSARPHLLAHMRACVSYAHVMYARRYAARGVIGRLGLSGSSGSLNDMSRSKPLSRCLLRVPGPNKALQWTSPNLPKKKRRFGAAPELVR